MADKSICTIQDCSKPAIARGWCNSHYRRWGKHGDPLKGQTKKGETTRFFHNVALAHAGDECLIWPFGRAGRGYGLMTLDGVRGYAHRFVCAAVNGPAPSEEIEAAHSCGNGHLGCVSPHHLRWATIRENHADKIQHGTSNRGERHGNSKLTVRDIHKIREMDGTVSRREIAVMFNIKSRTVGQIVRRESWGWL